MAFTFSHFGPHIWNNLPHQALCYSLFLQKPTQDISLLRIFQLSHIVLDSYQFVQFVQCVCVCVCVHTSLAWCVKTLADIFSSFFITFFISMYIMCVCFFSALSCRVGALHISILIIITKNYIFMGHSDVEDWNHLKQSIKNIVLSVREMCTVSFNCHQNVAIGMKTIPNQHKSATTEALQPRNESMLYYLNHLITDHWHVYILYI